MAGAAAGCATAIPDRNEPATRLHAAPAGFYYALSRAHSRLIVGAAAAFVLQIHQAHSELGTMRHHTVVVVLSTAMLALTHCTAAPRQRPVEMGPTSTGPGSVEYVRRQLQGTWALERFELLDTAGHAKPVKAQAILTYDEFGNMSAKGQLHEPMPGRSPEEVQKILDFSGRAIIDTNRHELRIQPVGTQAQPLDNGLKEQIGPQMVRRFNLNGDHLTIQYVNAEGRVTATTAFKRQKA